MTIPVRRRVLSVVIGTLLLVSHTAGAQTVTSGAIAGTVRDTTGAVLPGVTVEASSPALIEKVRSVTTDDQGSYKIINLRPGTYAVTFTLTGFGTSKREGIELTTGFTANVSAELKVGSLEETVTVTGASPVVDVQNIRQQHVITREALDTLPTGKGPQAFAQLTLGATGSGVDVGGSSQTRSQGISAHGGLQYDSQYQMDGMSYNTTHLGGGQAYYYVLNTVGVQEMTIQTDGFTAEAQNGGAIVNTVPRDGGNRFSVFGSAQYTDENMTSTNVSAALQARGLLPTPGIRKVYDYGIGVGGPLKRDRLWFYSSNRWNGSWLYQAGNYLNTSANPLFFTAGKATYGGQPTRDNGIRLTWQASPRHKFTMSENYQHQIISNKSYGADAPAGTVATSTPIVEETWAPLHLAQATWSHPRTSRLLLDAGVSIGYFLRKEDPGPFVQNNSISILEQTTGLRYGRTLPTGRTGLYGRKTSHNFNQRVGVSYVTGSHAIKVGAQFVEAMLDEDSPVDRFISYTFRSGVPLSVTQHANPIIRKQRSRTTAVYAQDQWSIRRLTLSYGVRFDHLYGYNPAIDWPAGGYVPLRHFDEVKDAPNWMDLSPRVGAAFDVFGNGKTAIKGSFGRFLAGYTGGTAMTEAVGPGASSVATANRTWNDVTFPVGDPRRGNFVPDCDFADLNGNGECGAISDRAFGTQRITRTFAKDYITGFGNRDYTNRWSGVLQQELQPGVGLTVGYFGNRYGNLTVAQNTAVQPSDFSPYCVTAPTDARLPGGGGNRLCGFWDVSPAKFGQSSVVVHPGSKFGSVNQWWHSIDVAVNARLPRRAFLQGGVSTSRMSYDACFALDRPDLTVYVQNPVTSGGSVALDNRPDTCAVTQPWATLTQFKVSGATPIVWGIDVSGNVQILPGLENRGNYIATSAEIAPSLGRNLAAGPTGTATIPLVDPYSLYEQRLTQVDLRFSKSVVVRGTRIKGMFDVYNASNSSTVLGNNQTFGPAWLRPTVGFAGRGAILAPRMFKVGAEVTF